MIPHVFYIVLILVNIWCMLVRFRLNQKNAASIVILGYKGAGKTTLWKQLKGDTLQEIRTTLMNEDVDSFSFEYKGSEKRILKSKDFSGDDNVLASEAFEHHIYEIIQDGTYIYYLINLNKLGENGFVEDTLARIEKITSIIKKKKIKNSKVGIKLVGTHLKEYLSDNPEKSETEALSNMISKLSLAKNKYNIDDKFMVAELTDRKYIDQFYKQIMG